MRFVNDHDPLPLLEQVRQRYGQQVTFRYAERQPEMIVIEFQISLGQHRKPHRPVAAAVVAAVAAAPASNARLRQAPAAA
jgi:uncharacterized protein (DUF2249 family)